MSVNQFDESFNLLDRGLSDALEKMESQMSIEDALRETLQELQSKMHLKLDRQELDSLRDQLESRIRQVQVVRATVKEKPIHYFNDNYSNQNINCSKYEYN